MNQFDQSLKLGKEVGERKPQYHSRDVIRFLTERNNPEAIEIIRKQIIGQNLDKKTIDRLLAEREIKLSVFEDIKTRLAEVSDEAGFFPKGKIKYVLGDLMLVDEFEAGWEKY